MAIKTVKEHTDEADAITKHVRDANALLIRLREELDYCRKTLHALRDFAPADQFKINAPYHLRAGTGNAEAQSMNLIIKAQTARINTLLGDRAE